MTRRLFRKSALAALLPGLLSGTALACSFHTYLPERTVVDRLLETENIVLARPDPENPFRFKAVTALEGTLEQADLPTLVDSSTRKRLQLNPDDTVLFARDGGPYGPFVRLAYIDPVYRQLLTTIMEQKDTWIMGADQERYQVFADRLGHPERTIDRLALRELDRAPYALLQSLDMAPNSSETLQKLWQPIEMPYIPIRILLLGFSDDTKARAELLAGLERGIAHGSVSYLGPYATALIESDKAAGVDTLQRLFLSNSTLRTAQLEPVIEAMAIHADAAEINGNAALRAHILDTLAEFVKASPERSDIIARQFLLRFDFGLSDALKSVLETGQIKSAKVIIPVSSYVMMAQQGTMQTQDAIPAME